MILDKLLLKYEGGLKLGPHPHPPKRKLPTKTLALLELNFRKKMVVFEKSVAVINQGADERTDLVSYEE